MRDRDLRWQLSLTMVVILWLSCAGGWIAFENGSELASELASGRRYSWAIWADLRPSELGMA